MSDEDLLPLLGNEDSAVVMSERAYETRYDADEEGGADDADGVGRRKIEMMF